MPLADLDEVLEATRTKLEELTEATAIAAANSKLRGELEALKKNNQQLTAELAKAGSSRSELESATARAATRIAELMVAADAARRKSARLEEALTQLQSQNDQLNNSITSAQTAVEAAKAKAEKAQAGMAQKLKEATDGAARAKAELAAAKEQLGQAASAAVEAERARQAQEAKPTHGRPTRREGVRSWPRRELRSSASPPRMPALSRGSPRWMRQQGRRRRAAVEPDRNGREDSGAEPCARPVGVAGGRGAARPAGRARPSGRRAGDRYLGGIPATRAGGSKQLGCWPTLGRCHRRRDRGAARGASRSGSGILAIPGGRSALNDVELKESGKDLFSGVKSVSGNAVDIRTTTLWGSLPPIGQQTYLDTLLERWVAEGSGEGPATVRIVDESGRC